MRLYHNPRHRINVCVSHLEILYSGGLLCSVTEG